MMYGLLESEIEILSYVINLVGLYYILKVSLITQIEGVIRLSLTRFYRMSHNDSQLKAHTCKLSKSVHARISNAK